MIQLNATTYSIPGLGDRMTAPVITIGGKDAKKFAPNLNIGYDFGGGEEYYDNLNRTDKIISAKSEVKHDGKKVRLIEGSDIDEIYTDDQGRMKWDVVFEKCPESFVLEWRRTCSPGLTAHYQDTLENEWKRNHVGTLEEFLATNYRPDDAIGSYAIYCDKAHNWIRPLNRKREIPADWQAQRAAGAELADLNIAAYRDYKNGKVSHRYRPFVVDADGKTEWCTLLIVGNVERVTLPKEFMASAKYPVRLDPTIGYTSAGASTTSTIYYIFIGNTNTTAASNGTASKVYAYVSGGTDLYLGYYSDISSLPASLIDSDVIATPPSSAAWTSVDVSGSILSGTKYSPALHASSDSTVLYRDSGGGGTGTHTFFRSAAGFAAEITAVGDSYYYYSVYLEYTESGGATAKPVSDSGTGSDTLRVVVDFSLSDSGTSSESILVKPKINIVDTSSGTDSDTVKAYIKQVDTGTINDGTPIIKAVFSLTDVGTVADDTRVFVKSIVTESGNYADAINSIKAYLRLGDSGLSADDLAIIAKLTLGETASGNDLATKGGNAYVALTDSGVGVDSISIRALLNLSDSALAADDDYERAAITISESGVSVDSIGVKALLSLLDSGITSDDIAKGDYQKIISDNGAFIDSITVVGNGGMVEDIYFSSPIVKTVSYSSPIQKTLNYKTPITKTLSYTAVLQ